MLGQRIGGARNPMAVRRDSVATASTSGSDMTREQALKTLGLEPGATATEIDAAYKKHAPQNGSLNGSEKLSQAREVLRGKEGA